MTKSKRIVTAIIGSTAGFLVFLTASSHYDRSGIFASAPSMNSYPDMRKKHGDHQDKGDAWHENHDQHEVLSVSSLIPDSSSRDYSTKTMTTSSSISTSMKEERTRKLLFGKVGKAVEKATKGRIKDIFGAGGKLAKWSNAPTGYISQLADVANLQKEIHVSISGLGKDVMTFTRPETWDDFLKDGMKSLGQNFEKFYDYGMDVTEDLVKDVVEILQKGKVGDKCGSNIFSCNFVTNICELMNSKRCFRTNTLDLFREKVCIKNKDNFLGGLFNVIGGKNAIKDVMGSILDFEDKKLNAGVPVLKQMLRLKDQVLCSGSATVYTIISISKNPLKDDHIQFGVFASDDGKYGVFMPNCRSEAFGFEKLPFPQKITNELDNLIQGIKDLPQDLIDKVIEPFLGRIFDMDRIEFPSLLEAGFNDFNRGSATPEFESFLSSGGLKQDTDLNAAQFLGAKFGILFGDSTHLEKKNWHFDWPLYDDFTFSQGVTASKVEHFEISAGAGFSPDIIPTRTCLPSVAFTLNEGQANVNVAKDLYDTDSGVADVGILYTVNGGANIGVNRKLLKNFSSLRGQEIYSGSIIFEVSAANDAHIFLGDADRYRRYTIMIGGQNNSHSVIKDSNYKNKFDPKQTPKILEKGVFRKFRISWDRNVIKLERFIEGQWEDVNSMVAYRNSENEADIVGDDGYNLDRASVWTGRGSTGAWRLINVDTTLLKKDREVGRFVTINVGKSNERSKTIYLPDGNLVFDPQGSENGKWNDPKGTVSFATEVVGKRLTITRIDTTSPNNNPPNFWNDNFKFRAFPTNVHQIAVGPSNGFSSKTVELPYPNLSVDPPQGFAVHIKGGYFTIYAHQSRNKWDEDMKVSAYYTDVRFQAPANTDSVVKYLKIPNVANMMIDPAEQDGDNLNREWDCIKMENDDYVAVRANPTKSWGNLQPKFRAVNENYFIVFMDGNDSVQTPGGNCSDSGCTMYRNEFELPTESFTIDPQPIEEFDDLNTVDIFKSGNKVVVYGKGAQKSIKLRVFEYMPMPPKPAIPSGGFQGLLSPGVPLFSANGNFKLLFQNDGNLVHYDNILKKAIWSSKTSGISPWSTKMQGDGNFIVRDTQRNVKFATNTNGNPGSYLLVQDDGNLVIYDAYGTPLWNRFNGRIY